LKSRGAHGVR